MAETKTTTPATPAKTEEVKTPAPVTEDQMSTGPAVEEVTDTGSRKYFLRPGAKHHVLIEGEIKELTEPGQSVELTDAQYTAFRDKFFTKEEWNAHKASADALAEGARAATLAQTMEQPSVEAQQNLDNEVNKKDNTGKPAA